jgi:hypothetical protein
VRRSVLDSVAPPDIGAAGELLDRQPGRARRDAARLRTAARVRANPIRSCAATGARCWPVCRRP